MKKILIYIVFIISTHHALAGNRPSQVNSTALSPIGEKPNIIFVLIDDLGWNGVSCFGNKHVDTPNIDALAKGGIKFTDAYAMPQCSPTRYSFFTGQYCARTHMTAVTFEKHVLPCTFETTESRKNLRSRCRHYWQSIETGWLQSRIFREVACRLERKDEQKKLGGFKKYLNAYGFDPMLGKKINNDPKGVMSLTEKALGYLKENRKSPSLPISLIRPYTQYWTLLRP